MNRKKHNKNSNLSTFFSLKLVCNTSKQPSRPPKLVWIFLWNKSNFRAFIERANEQMKSFLKLIIRALNRSKSSLVHKWCLGPNKEIYKKNHQLIDFLREIRERFSLRVSPPLTFAGEEGSRVNKIFLRLLNPTRVLFFFNLLSHIHWAKK